ncbi:hypothetical protein A5N16_10100 [Arthrobacter sp. M6]|nr:hypothetical protein [Arthrobacter sp. M6]
MVLGMRTRDPQFPYTDFDRQTFFMPGFDAPAAEEVYGFLHGALLGRPVSDLRIQRLRYIRGGLPRIAEVGDAEHRGEKFVMGIFGPCVKHGDYYIVTVRRGLECPENAIRVHSNEIRDLEYFL